MNGIEAARRPMMKSLNLVCHLDPKYGGISSSVPALTKATAVTGRYSADLLALTRGEERFDIERVHQMTVKTLPYESFRPFADMRILGPLADVVRNTDIVHIHGLWQQHCLVGTWLARAFKKPCIVSAHGMLEPWAVRSKWFKKRVYAALLERRQLLGTNCLRALTVDEVDDFRKFGIRAAAVVIPNGIEIPDAVAPDMFFDQFPITRGRKVALFLSRIHYKKGLDILCRAWAALDAEHKDSILVLAGPDSENSQRTLEELIRHLGISDRVLFTGMLVGRLKWSALAAAQVFVLPSYSEGFSVAALEAMGMGTPVLISNRCHFPEVGTSGCGWVIELNVEALERTLRDALSMSEAEANAMGKKGRELVARKYVWSRIGEQMADVYDWLLGGSRPTSVEIL